MYTLIGSVTSPYVRKLRLFFHYHNVSYEFKPIDYLEKNDAQFLKSINPINKIPVLLIDGKPLYDSRIIYYYFANKLNLKPLSLEEENILSTIDAGMDTSINLFSLRRGGIDIQNSGNAYIERQKERIPLILNALKPFVANLNPNQETDWNFLTMSLYSYFYWGQFRNILDLSEFPEMLKFVDDFKNKPFLKETEIKA